MSEVGGVDGRDVRVFLVDDHQVLVESLAQALDSQPGIDVTGHASDIDAAMRRLAEHPVDVVLLDLRLQHRDTVADIPAFTALDDPPAVVILTATADRRNATRALEAGASGYLVKDEPLEVVAKSIVAAARGETPISASLLSGVLRQLAGSRPDVLTTRELDVLQLLASGRSVQEIASELIISYNTTRNHIQRVLNKLGARSRLEAVVKGRNDGLID